MTLNRLGQSYAAWPPPHRGAAFARAVPSASSLLHTLLPPCLAPAFSLRPGMLLPLHRWVRPLLRPRVQPPTARLWRTSPPRPGQVSVPVPGGPMPLRLGYCAGQSWPGPRRLKNRCARHSNAAPTCSCRGLCPGGCALAGDREEDSWPCTPQGGTRPSSRQTTSPCPGPPQQVPLDSFWSRGAQPGARRPGSGSSLAGLCCAAGRIPARLWAGGGDGKLSFQTWIFPARSTPGPASASAAMDCSPLPPPAPAGVGPRPGMSWLMCPRPECLPSLTGGPRLEGAASACVGTQCGGGSAPLPGLGAGPLLE